MKEEKNKIHRARCSYSPLIMCYNIRAHFQSQIHGLKNTDILMPYKILDQ